MIKNAITYNVKLPSNSVELREFITDESMSKKPEPDQRFNVGFTEKFGQRVIDFPGGYVFFIEIWDKKLKGKIINQLTDEKVSHVEKTEGRVVGRKEKRDLKDEIIFDQLSKAEPERTLVTVFYHIESGLMIVDTTNTGHSDLVTGHMIQTIGSIEAKTIYIDQTNGVTQHVADMIEESNDWFMNGFMVNGLIVLSSPHGEEVRFKGSAWHELSEDREKQTIYELIKESLYTVSQFRLSDEYLSFTLSKEFKFSQIKFADSPEPEQFEDECEAFKTDCFHDVNQLVKVTKALTDKFTVIKE